MKCKNCKTELKKDAKTCPSCGTSVKQKKARRKLPVWVRVIIFTVAFLLVITAATAIWWSVEEVESFKEGWTLVVNQFNPPENNVFYKDSYSASDKKVVSWRDKEIASVGGVTLTNGELQVYYWMNVYDFLNNYGYYAVYAGLDYTKPFDTQPCPETEGYWQHFFLDDALLNWRKYQSMALLAEKEGLGLSDEAQNELDTLRQKLAQQTVDSGYSSIDAMLQADMGAGVTYEDYYSYMETYYKGYQYFEKKYAETEAALTMEAIESYFIANQADLAESGVTKESGDQYDVRNVLITPEGGTKDTAGNISYSEEEWEACRQKAQQLLDEWVAGDATEDTFAAMAKEHSKDTDTKANGGLYTGLDRDSGALEQIQSWYLEKGRKEGDYTLVKTDKGYHILYMSKIEAEWIRTCRDGLLSQAAENIAATAMSGYPIRVLYKDIVLGVVDLNKTTSE